MLNKTLPPCNNTKYHIIANCRYKLIAIYKVNFHVNVISSLEQTVTLQNTRAIKPRFRTILAEGTFMHNFG